MEKQKLIEQLTHVAKLMRILDENEFKVRAYEKGASAIEGSTESLSDIAEGKVKIAGVGEGLKTAISDFLNTGKVTSLEEFEKKVPEGVLAIMEVPGVGPKKAMLLHHELGITSIGELEYACNENRLITIKGFGKAIQDKISKGIEEHKSYQGKLRIDEALILAEEHEKILHKKYPKSEIIRVGEIARLHEVIETLEFVVGGTDAPTKKLEEKLPQGITVKLHSFKKLPPNEELMKLTVPFEALPQFEKKIAHFRDWEPTWLESEWIGSDRKPPKDAYQVKKHGKVKGIFHNHTNLSDGQSTLEEMVREAEKLGFEYIGISDHSQSAFYANGLKPEAIKKQSQEIKALQKKVSIKIFHGVESDILSDGALDYDDEILKNLDFIVGSVHSRFKMDEEQMTERLTRALSHPRITFWGHPTGRLILGRQGYKLNWKKCFDAIEKNHTVIELNCNPQRLDIDWRHGAELEKRGIKICINPDAHSTEGLSDTRLGEFFAEKAMIPKSQILNLMNVDEIEKFLHDRKK